MMEIQATITKEAGTAKAAPCDWVESYGDYLFNYAVGQVRDHSVAEDLVQETFLAALKAQDHFHGRSSERTWLTGILRHKIYDHLRKSCRERTRLQVPSDGGAADEAIDESLCWLHETAADCLQPHRRMELQELRAALEMALGQLPPHIAQVFQLCEVEERATAEVCARLQITETNLWVMLHRARKQLRGLLGGWWPGRKANERAASTTT